MTTDIQQFRQADHDIDSIYVKRWSPRSFLEKEVPEDVLLRVFEAARWAPSAMNIQPWRFIIARTQEDKEKFHSFIMDGNRKWCEKAPVLALLISDKQSNTHAFDTGAAWGYLSLQAAKEGLITHGMGGFYKDKARELLNIPDEFDIQALVAIGYQGEKEALDEQLQAREKPSDRRPVQESVMEGTFV
ncbi:nitroreductase family protein [Lentibacillus juripiscarius]|uniref:Nitroreductase family protein n=1 Tax=Lentibacillus juripiscarius TaxID=257446 RepID=A0ABW5V9V4_9BACI